MQRGDIVTLWPLGDELIVCFDEFFAQYAILDAGTAACCHAPLEGGRAAPYIVLPFLTAVIDFMLVVLAALTALDDTSERVLWYGLSDQLLVLSLLP